MGQKVNPHGLRVKLSKIGILSGMQMQISQIALLKTTTSENS